MKNHSFFPIFVILFPILENIVFKFATTNNIFKSKFN